MHNIDNTGARWEPMDLQINTDEENDNFLYRVSFTKFVTKFGKCKIVKA